MPSPSWAPPIALAFALLLLGGCGGRHDPPPSDAGTDASTSMTDGGLPDAGPMPQPKVALFRLATEGDDEYFELPWPNDLRRTSDGFVDVADFPIERNFLAKSYVDAISGAIRGWGANGAAYQRFSVSVDPATLPASVDETLAEGASVFLLDVDAESPSRGARHPAVVRYQDAETKYWHARTVSVRPVHGEPLAWGRTYAVVFTRDVAPADGGVFERDDDFACIMENEPACADARAVYQEAIDALPLAGVDPADVLSMAVFTVQDHFRELLAMRDWVMENYEEPAVLGALALGVDGAGFVEVVGDYGPSPIFQQGQVPYMSTGGNIEFVDGEPVLVGSFDARFSLSIPDSDMPPSGYPLVLYAHGTGGDYRSYIRGGTAVDLAAVGIAVMGVDQIHHGERDPTNGNTELLVYNVINPQAFRDNARQSAIDVVQQARLVEHLVVPGELLDRAEDVFFDVDNVFFFGHSQGGQNGPLFLAIDDHTRGGVLSGAGSLIGYALLEKTEPLDVRSIVRSVLGLAGNDVDDAFAREAFGHDHPMMSLLQMWIDVADAGNYAHLFYTSPREDFAPKSILQTLGTTDPFTPPGSMVALATAARIPLCSEELVPMEELERIGVTALVPPVTANVAEGEATACLLQQEGGHFVAFDDPALSQTVGFFETMVDAVPTVPDPPP